MKYSLPYLTEDDAEDLACWSRVAFRGLTFRVKIEGILPDADLADIDDWKIVAHLDRRDVETLGAATVGELHRDHPEAYKAAKEARDYNAAQRGLLYRAAYDAEVGARLFNADTRALFRDALEYGASFAEAPAGIADIDFGPCFEGDDRDELVARVLFAEVVYPCASRSLRFHHGINMPPVQVGLCAERIAPAFTLHAFQIVACIKERVELGLNV